jgi:hypothetical protein
MEQFFAPSRRYQDQTDYDWLYNDDDDESLPFVYTEVELTMSLLKFLCNFTWDWEVLRDYCLSGGGTSKMLWITAHSFFVVVVGENGLYFDDANAWEICEYSHAVIQDASGQEHTLILAHHQDYPGPSSAEACFFWNVLATTESVKLSISNDSNRLELPSDYLLQFLQGSPLLQLLEFKYFRFKEEHCRALIATLQETDLKVKFKSCEFEPQGAEDVFIEWFRNNQVVTELDCCHMDNSILHALSGNHSLKKLMIKKLYNRSIELGGEEAMHSLLESLSGNIGIEHLGIFYLEETSDDTKSTLMDAIIQMLYLNTVVHTFELPDAFNDEEVYQNSILPRLEMNRSLFEVQREAVKRADPAIRPQLLGRALHVVRYNPNLVFRFLSENVPAFVGSAD